MQNKRKKLKIPHLNDPSNYEINTWALKNLKETPND